MKRIKLFIMLILISTLSTGCSVEYNLTINKDTIQEDIIVNDIITSKRTKEKILNHYNKWYPTYINYITSGESIPLPNYNSKYNGIEYYDKTIKEIENGYQYNYKYTHGLDRYYDAYVLGVAFPDTSIYESNKLLVFQTSSTSFLCDYDYFDKLTINIKVDEDVYEVSKHNAKKANNNIYSWTISRNDCDNSSIYLTLEKKPVSKNKENKKIKESEFALYLFCGIIIILVLIGYFIIKKKKKQLDDFNIDD